MRDRASLIARAGDRDGVYDRLRGFVLPYLDIRDRSAGYAVSIVKAGLDAVGHRGGAVRPPLQTLDGSERAELTALIQSVSATSVA